MSDYNDIANELVRVLCNDLNLHPNNVREIRLGPRSITVDSFELNDDGHKFIADNGTIADTLHTLKFTYKAQPAVAPSPSPPT